MEKIVRAVAIYGLVIDRKTLVDVLSNDVEFAKHMLKSPENEVTHYIYSKLDDVTSDRGLKWSRGEVTEGSEIFVFGRDIMSMKDDETFGDFKRSTEEYISNIIPVEFSCSIITVPEGVYWS